MDCHFDTELARSYHSPSQQIRVLTEAWVLHNIFCPRCGNPRMEHFPNNASVADYFCPACKSEYELKSKRNSIGRKIADGAYDTFIDRITSNHNPDFLIMTYDPTALCVNNLFLIPKHFFTPAIVEKRAPLSATARRAGWIGCNILFQDIPSQGQVPIVTNRTCEEKETVLAAVKSADKLFAKNIEARGWLMDVLWCVNQVASPSFTLEAMYRYDSLLSAKHPENHNVRPKIRQQLQVLRDKGFIEFLKPGLYRKL